MYPGLTAHGSRWRFRVGPKGAQKWVTVPPEYCRTKTVAGKWMLDYKGQGQALVPSTVRFERYFTDWIKRAELSARTRETYETDYRNHLRFLDPVKVSDIGRSHPLAVLARMDKRDDGRPYSGRTKGKVLATLSAVLTSAVADGLLASNPVKTMQKRDRPKGTGRTFKRILTPEEANSLLTTAGKYAPMVSVALFAGLRKGEILQLRWKDVDFNEGLIRLGPPIQLKTAASKRNVEMSPTLVENLKRHRRETRYRGPDHLVFCTATGRPYSPRNVSRMLDTVVGKAGLHDPEKPLGFHVLRHNFGSNLIARGLDVVTVQVQIGHADPAITHQIYSHEVRHAREGGAVAAAIEAAFAR